MNITNNTEEILLLEQKVIGNILILDKEEQYKRIESININLFELEYHKMIFQIMKELKEKEEDINITTVVNKIENNSSEDVRNLTTYTAIVIYKNEIDSAINILNKNAECRNAKNILQNALQKINQNNYLDVVTEITKKIEAFEEDATKDEESQTSKMMNSYMDIIDDIFNKKSYPKWNIKILDELSNGIRPGESTVIAGPSGTGKTAIIMQIILGLVEQNKKVIFFNLEMNLKSMIKRILSHVFGISIQEIENSKDLNQEAMYNYFYALCNTGNFLLYDDIRTIEDMRRIIRIERPDFVAIDYLQLCSCNERDFYNREQEVAYISREFKELSKKFDCHIVQLSQVNADAIDHRPKGEKGLRESKAIYHSVDNCIYLWEPSETYFKNDYMNRTFIDIGGTEARLESYEEYEEMRNIKGRKLVEIIFDKQRQGRQGRSINILIGATTKYINTTFEKNIIKNNNKVVQNTNKNKKPSFK